MALTVTDPHALVGKLLGAEADRDEFREAAADMHQALLGLIVLAERGSYQNTHGALLRDAPSIKRARAAVARIPTAKLEHA